MVLAVLICQDLLWGGAGGARLGIRCGIAMIFNCFTPNSSASNRQALLQAITKGNLLKVRRCLDKAADKETLYQAFWEAVQRDSVDTARLILEKGGFDARRDGDRVIGEGGPKCTAMLLKRGFSPDAIRLERIWDFCREGHLDLVKALLPRFIMESVGAKEADLLGLMVSAAHGGHLEVIRWIHRETQARYGPKHVACDSGDCDLETLISTGQFECFKYLYDELGHGEFCESPIPFWEAMALTQSDVIGYLIQTSKAVDIRFNDDWLLREALQRGYDDVVRLLIARGVPASAQHNLAMKVASSTGNDHLVRFLVEHGTELCIIR
jgi:hypothetical protein